MTERRLWKLAAGLAAASVAGVAVGLALTACGSSAAADGPANTDPRKGWVRVFDSEYARYAVDKRCDGRTLLYDTHDGVSAVPHADECLP